MAGHLAETLQRLGAGLDAAERQHYDQLADVVRKLGQRDLALAPGTQAPDFRLPRGSGAALSFSELYRQRPTLLVFARGPWCPFCIAEMEAIRDHWPAFEAAGIGVVAVTPTVNGGAQTLADDLKLPFPVLCDVGGGVTLAYGCLFALPETAFAYLNDDTFSLAALFGDEGRFMPLPTCFGVNGDGTVLTSAGETDMRAFPAIEDLLDDFKTALLDEKTGQRS